MTNVDAVYHLLCCSFLYRPGRTYDVGQDRTGVTMREGTYRINGETVTVKRTRSGYMLRFRNRTVFV